MHLLVTVCIIAAGFFSKTYKEWKRYYTTMLYIALCDLAYHYICQDYPLWTYRPQWIITSQLLTDFLYTLLFLPVTALIFLAHYPGKHPFHRNKILYVGTWIAAYLVWEWLLLLAKGISHEHGWNLAWSALFYLIMFPMLLLHHYKPLRAIAVSLLAIAFWIVVFHVPLH